MRSYPTTAFVKQFNLKNASVFFINAFKRKAALNKGSLFYISALVIAFKFMRGPFSDAINVGQNGDKPTQKMGMDATYGFNVFF